MHEDWALIIGLMSMAFDKVIRGKKVRIIQREILETRRDNWPCCEFYPSVITEGHLLLFSQFNSVNPPPLTHPPTDTQMQTVAFELCPSPLSPIIYISPLSNVASHIQKLNIMSRSMAWLSCTLSPTKYIVTDHMYTHPSTRHHPMRATPHKHSSFICRLHCYDCCYASFLYTTLEGSLPPVWCVTGTIASFDQLPSNL